MSSGIPIFIGGGGGLKKRGSPDSSSPEVGISDTVGERRDVGHFWDSKEGFSLGQGTLHISGFSRKLKKLS